MLHRESHGSHLHSLAFEDGHLCRTTGFDYESIDRNIDDIEPAEDMISMADASAAVSIILGEICGHRKTAHAVNLAFVGAKAEALLFLLDSNQSRYKSLADIAREADCSRANLSKWLLRLKDEVNVLLSAGKSDGSREVFSKAQRAALSAGVHSSQRRQRSSRSRAKPAQALSTPTIAE